MQRCAALDITAGTSLFTYDLYCWSTPPSLQLSSFVRDTAFERNLDSIDMYSGLCTDVPLYASMIPTARVSGIAFPEVSDWHTL